MTIEICFFPKDKRIEYSLPRKVTKLGDKISYDVFFEDKLVLSFLGNPHTRNAPGIKTGVDQFLKRKPFYGVVWLTDLRTFDEKVITAIFKDILLNTKSQESHYFSVVIPGDYEEFMRKILRNLVKEHLLFRDLRSMPVMAIAINMKTGRTTSGTGPKAITCEII